MVRSWRRPSGPTPVTALALRGLEEPQPTWSIDGSSRPTVDLNYPLRFFENIDCKDCFNPVLVNYKSTRSLGGKNQNASYLQFYLKKIRKNFKKKNLNFFRFLILENQLLVIKIN